MASSTSLPPTKFDPFTSPFEDPQTARAQAPKDEWDEWEDSSGAEDSEGKTRAAEQGIHVDLLGDSPATSPIATTTPNNKAHATPKGKSKPRSRTHKTKIG